ncbi:holo-acyl-carrier-protein synthase [Denitrovibrio acetiphilus DSM 12809]|uniref:Holo-[acyl-carrier-protein] synthase n=1 Tax=Denitrovibrio acetiphilus (strain DSM 12809 / NBRC 114555 / N2460) TaxID=522772 RepID=D4H7S5_DENA2|nr:holo-ACP synthase [Denitrovibrio acetiphilus]ADD68074.1 holo-acyl-carrier-protein synthase [Denitrovibrio acetiphilus DSM 12809]
MLGCDIIETERLKDALERHGDAFVHRILSKCEIDIFRKRNDSITFLAGRFAAKESISKSLGTGIGKISFNEIEILNDNAGAPVVYLCGKLREDIQLSISHSKTCAMAVSIIVR